MLTLLCTLVSSALSGDTVIDYHGPHPVPDSIEHGMCWIEGPHFHSYEPADRVLYVEDDDHLVFVGDPTEYERASPSAVYYGHHPVTWTIAYDEPVHYCYITGPHHHWHAPPPTTTVWVEKGGAWWYVGKHPAWYESRVKKHKHIDAHYARAHVIERPTVVVAPPSGWIGVTFGGGRSGVSASIGFGVNVVHAPPVVHHRPVVIVEEHHHHHHKHKHGHGHGHGKHKHKGKGRWH